MKFEQLVVTGDPLFVNRHKFLFQALSSYFEQIEFIQTNNLYYQSKLYNFFRRLSYKINTLVAPNKAEKLWKNERGFITRSKITEQKIRQLAYVPDLVFQVFSMSNPFWDKFDIPYVTYLDYTMALAKRNWSLWAPFNNEREFAAWLNCERIAYAQAHHLFTMSELVKSSLVKDYNISPDKITVVGSSGNFPAPYDGEKTFGSKQLLFNGSEFERKGGDLVLAAFKQIKKAITEAKLVIIGKNLDIHEDGVTTPGYISSFWDMQNLFLETDLVVAPGRCDPFPTFIMEAMSYGIPCMVSARDGMPEIVDNKVNGIVIEQPTPEIMAAQITNLLGDVSVLESMSLMARQKIKSQLNWNEIAKKITQVLST